MTHPAPLSPHPQLYGYCYQDSEDIPDTLTTITELGAPVEMIQLLQTSWEDRFRVSREEGRALGSLLGWFSLRRPTHQNSFHPPQQWGRERAKLTRPSAKGLKKEARYRGPRLFFVLQLHTLFPHIHLAWLQKG